MPSNSIPKSIFNSLQSKDKSTAEELSGEDYDQNQYDDDDDDDEDNGTIHTIGPNVDPNTLLHTLTQKENEKYDNHNKQNTLNSSDKIDDDNFLNISDKNSDGDINMKALIPGPPRDLVAQLVNRYVTLSWMEPSKNPDEVISYTVFYKVASSDRYVKNAAFR